ncbi:O-antigen ligase family protein [bacterium]|nr:O-antigen ligase family protein [bacterium]
MGPYLKITFFPIFVFFAIFPFFEGLETPAGLFIAHTLVFVSLIYVVLSYRKIWLPPYLGRFSAFLLILILSTIIAPYKYAAFLELWDYWIAAIFAILVYSLFKENENSIEHIAIICFFIGSVSTILSLLLIPNPNLRWSGSFVSPLDFGIFCLLLFLLGLFCFERATLTVWKVAISICLIFLVTSIAMASSRAVFLATFVMLIYYLWRKRSSRLISTFLVIALMSSAVLIYVRLFHYESDPFQYYRLKIWKYSLQGILKDPYLGIGLNMLPYKAAQFNFPADQEVGRFSRIATSADNQYLQILIETGFVGFFLFLIGWISLYFGLRKLPTRFLAFQGACIALTIISFFTLPLMNTSVLFLFLFLILFPLPFDPEAKSRSVSFPRPVSIVLAVSLIGLFLFAVYFPYRAHQEARAYAKSRNAAEAEKHLKAALKFNPYQPYTEFVPIRNMVDARLKLKPEQWLGIAKRMDHLIELNPLEPDFHIYKAKIFRILLEDTQNPKYYQQAIYCYQLAVQQSPFNVFLRIEYAYFEKRLGHLERSESELKEILRLEPVYLNARLLLVEVLFKQGKYEAAKKELQEVERLEKRYTYLKFSVNEPYVRKLIAIDNTYKKQLENLILNAPKT